MSELTLAKNSGPNEMSRKGKQEGEIGQDKGIPAVLPVRLCPFSRPRKVTEIYPGIKIA
jgi:hypothetical protein